MPTLNPTQDMSTLPARMKHLPLGPNGYLVPWFVVWLNGAPEFRAFDVRKWLQAVRDRLCWVCGNRLGSYLTFVIGPMCVITRTTSEPACHRECAAWSAENCPFLSRPHMVRREAGMPEEAQPPAGIAITRNPGVSALYITRGFSVFRDDEGKPLIKVGQPIEIEWYAEGRAATRHEVLHSIDTGYPLLWSVAEMEGPEAMRDLEELRGTITEWLPTE